MGGVKVPLVKLPEFSAVFVQPIPGYGGHLEGTKAENKHGATFGMLRDGEDRMFGELCRKPGPAVRSLHFPRSHILTSFRRVYLIHSLSLSNS